MKKTIYLHALLHSPQAPATISIFDCDMSRYGSGVVFETREIEFSPPPQDGLISRQVELLKAERDKIYADAQAKAAEITERLEKFLAITNQPTEPSA